jgi:hypothetical protein
MGFDLLVLDPELPAGVRNAFAVTALAGLYTVSMFVACLVAWRRVRAGRPLRRRRPPLRGLRLAAFTGGLLAIAGWWWGTGWSLERLDADAPEGPLSVHPLQVDAGYLLLGLGAGVAIIAVAVRLLWSASWPRLSAAASPEPASRLGPTLFLDDEPPLDAAAAAPQAPPPSSDPPALS